MKRWCRANRKRRLLFSEAVPARHGFLFFYESAPVFWVLNLRNLFRTIERLSAFPFPSHALEKVKTLRIYSDYPVDMERISHDEFEFYLDILCETIFTMQLDKSDYMPHIPVPELSKKQAALPCTALFHHMRQAGSLLSQQPHRNTGILSAAQPPTA